MQRFVGSKDILSQVPGIPRSFTALELEASQPGLKDKLLTADDLPEDLLDELEKANTKSPVFTMAGYMARMQDARVAANFIKEHLGLDVYKKEDFQKVRSLYESESDPVLYGLLGSPKNVGNGGLYITSETYNTLQGSKEVAISGAWFDGPQYPKELRESWLEKGEYIEWQGNPARFLDPKNLYGEKLGSALQEWHTGNILKTMAWDKTKIGSKLIGFGFGLWFFSILVIKRYQLQYRDHLTAQMIFADRLKSLDDYYPTTEANIHKNLQLRGYLQNYFEEDDDEEV